MTTEPKVLTDADEVAWDVGYFGKNKTGKMSLMKGGGIRLEWAGKVVIVPDFEELVRRAAGAASVPKSCAWARDGEYSDTWATQCRHYWMLIDGTPSDNGMKHCPYCGGTLDADDAAQREEK